MEYVCLLNKSPLTGLRILSQSFDRDTNQAALTSEPSKTYQITTSLDLESFPTVLTTLPGNAGTSETTVPHSAVSKLFFRVEEVSNP